MSKNCVCLNIALKDPHKNINILELIPVWLSLLRWGKYWVGNHVVCMTDNTQVMAMLNKGVSSNVLCMDIIRAIFWLCAVFNIHISARHVAGVDNVYADFLSRLSVSNSVLNTLPMSFCCSDLCRVE